MNIHIVLLQESNISYAMHGTDEYDGEKKKCSGIFVRLKKVLF